MKFRVLIGMLVVGLAVSASVAMGNLITDGSFEAASITGAWTIDGGTGYTHAKDWGWAHDGNNMVGMWWWGNIYQDFSATAGSGEYGASIATFLPGEDYASGGVYGFIQLQWVNSSGDWLENAWQYSFSSDGAAGSQVHALNSWIVVNTPDEYTPHADAAYGRIIVGINNNGSGGGRVYYDSVTLNVIPEPAAVALLGIGGLMAVALRRKTRK